MYMLFTALGLDCTSQGYIRYVYEEINITVRTVYIQ